MTPKETRDKPSSRKKPTDRPRGAAVADLGGPPRLLSRDQAAVYLGAVSVDTIDRLINAQAISIVRLPVERTGGGANRRILIDRAELDALIPAWREKRT